VIERPIFTLGVLRTCSLPAGASRLRPERCRRRKNDARLPRECFQRNAAPISFSGKNRLRAEHLSFGCRAGRWYARLHVGKPSLIEIGEQPRRRPARVE
jgi:hypothetical protein